MLQPISSIKARLGIEPNGRVQKFFTNTCYSHMGKYVPGGDTGLLNTNVTLQADSITYKSPYAHYQYVGKLYVMPTNNKGAYYSEDYGYWSEPGLAKVPTSRDLKVNTGGSYWDKNMWTAEKDKVIEETQQYLRSGK